VAAAGGLPERKMIKWKPMMISRACDLWYGGGGRPRKEGGCRASRQVGRSGEARGRSRGPVRGGQTFATALYSARGRDG